MYSIEIADAIRQFLTGDDWHFSFNEETGIFTMNLSLKCKLKEVSYSIHVNDDRYTVYTICPINADTDDPKQMATMAEFICRANYGLSIGNFEFDFRDGEIRYKVTETGEASEMTPDSIRESIYIPAIMFERYSKGILNIIFNDADAATCIEQCEAEED